jgi:hypothetical protein
MTAFHPICDIQAAVANDRFGVELRKARNEHRLSGPAPISVSGS